MMPAPACEQGNPGGVNRATGRTHKHTTRAPPNDHAKCWRTGSSPAVSPRVSRGVRCSPHGIPEYYIANMGSPPIRHHLARHDGRRELHRTSAAAPPVRHTADTTISRHHGSGTAVPSYTEQHPFPGTAYPLQPGSSQTSSSRQTTESSSKRSAATSRSCSASSRPPTSRSMMSLRNFSNP